MACEANRVGYVFGLARNQWLEGRIAGAMARAEATSAATGKSARLFADFLWTTRDSWSSRRRVVAKAEWTGGGPNPRFVVTSLKPREWGARALYQDLYCARGEMENRIKEQQLQLFSDRTSCHRWWPNQFRLLLASLAYTLMAAIRRRGLMGPEYARAQVTTIRLKLLKIGAVIVRNTRRVRVHLSSACADQDLFRLLAARLDPG